MANNNITVDEFIKTKIKSEFREAAEYIRAVMREYAPNSKELVGYGIPMWRGNKMLAVLSPTKTEITFSFSRGAEFEDKYKLLGGVGKVSKFIKLKEVNDVSKTQLAYYIKQALKLDEAK